MKLTKLQKIPKDYKKPRIEKNLLKYKDFEIWVNENSGKITGFARLGISMDGSRGLITDYFGTTDVLEKAEKILLGYGVKNIEAFYRDSPGILTDYYKLGYKPTRKVVEIGWDFKSLIITSTKGSEFMLKIMNYKDNPDEIKNLFENSFQPYWQPIRDFRKRKLLVAYQNGLAVGMVDSKFKYGVIIRKGFGGNGLGSFLLKNLFSSMQKENIQSTSILVTSGLDDYDPQVYLYAMNGGKILCEYIVLTKSP